MAEATVQVLVRFPPYLKRCLEDFAHERDLFESQVIRDAVARYLTSPDCDCSRKPATELSPESN